MGIFCCFKPKVKPNEASDGKKGSICLVLLGVDNAGKTTLLSALKGQAQDHITPTWGFTSDVVTIGGRKITLYDLGGGKRIRAIWERYFSEVHGAVFVVDSADATRLDEAREVLETAAKDPRMKGKPFLVLANKQDAPTALPPASLATSLSLDSLLDPSLARSSPCAARIPSGGKLDPHISDGLAWLLDRIDEHWPALTAKVAHDSAEEKRVEEQKRAERKARVEASRKERAEEAAATGPGPGEKAAATKKAGEAEAPIERPVESAAPEATTKPVDPSHHPPSSSLTNGAAHTAGAEDDADATILLEDDRARRLSDAQASTAAVHLQSAGPSPLKATDAWGDRSGDDGPPGLGAGATRKLSFGAGAGAGAERPPPFVPAALDAMSPSVAGAEVSRVHDADASSIAALPPGALPSPTAEGRGGGGGALDDTSLLNDISVLDPGHGHGAGSGGLQLGASLSRGARGVDVELEAVGGAPGTVPTE